MVPSAPASRVTCFNSEYLWLVFICLKLSLPLVLTLDCLHPSGANLIAGRCSPVKARVKGHESEDTTPR